jgi:hypothetical protein
MCKPFCDPRIEISHRQITPSPYFKIVKSINLDYIWMPKLDIFSATSVGCLLLLYIYVWQEQFLGKNAI